MLDFASAALIGLTVEIGLYGAYCVLFLIGVYVVFNKKTINPFLVSAGLLSFVLCTVHIAVDIRRTSTGFAPDQSNPTVTVYTAYSYAPSIADYVMVTNSLIVDAVLIWRCFALWNENIWICVLPTILVIGTAISGFGSVYYVVPPSSGAIIGPTDAIWGKTSLGLAISANILTTSLITGRIWYMKRCFRLSPSGSTGRNAEDLNLAMMLIIDTGMVYSFTLIAQLVLYVMQSDAIVIVISALSQIMGIVPTLIIVGGTLGKM